jgi:hypothetical protein
VPEITEQPTLMLNIRKTLHFYAIMLVQNWRDFVWPLVKPEFDRPIFIVGCSRSGTTAVYKVLGMSPHIASMNKESHHFWNLLHPPEEKNWDSHVLAAENVGERDQDNVSRYYFRTLGARRFVDKANQNCFRIPYLYKLFPSAIFLYVKRDGRDNINSLIHGWGRPDEYGNWSHSLPANVQIENGKYTRWCFFLFPQWRSFLNASIEEVCAEQWIKANEAVISAKPLIPSSQLVEMFYEDILRDPVETFQRVFEKLDLTFTDEIRHHCSNLSLKPYNAFSPPRLNKWKDENREKIERIIPKIKDTMIRMGFNI